MADTSAIWLVLTTEADADRAERLAEALLERRLVACVSLTQIHSLFHWQGGLMRDNEVQLLLKTSTACLEQLRHDLTQLHSYDTPEWISWPVETSPDYGSWALDAVSSDALPPAASVTPENGPPAG